MAKERDRFVEGCARVNGIAEATANAIFDFIARFAEYGFNKSHSAAYGWVSYQTAYLKAHYPVEFMAALLTHDASTTDRIAEVIAECSRMGHQNSGARCQFQQPAFHPGSTPVKGWPSALGLPRSRMSARRDAVV